MLTSCNSTFRPYALKESPKPAATSAPESGLRSLISSRPANKPAAPASKPRAAASTTTSAPPRSQNRPRLFGSRTESNEFIGFPIQRVSAVNESGQVLIAAYDQSSDLNLTLFDDKGRVLGQVPLQPGQEPIGAAPGNSKFSFLVLMASGEIVQVESRLGRMTLNENSGRLPGAIDLAAGPEGKLYAITKSGQVYVYSDGVWAAQRISGVQVRDVVAISADPETGDLAILGRVSGSSRMSVILTDGDLGGARSFRLPSGTTGATDIVTSGGSTIVAYEQGGAKLGVFDGSGSLQSSQDGASMNSLSLDPKDSSVWVVGPSGQMTRQTFE